MSDLSEDELSWVRVTVTVRLIAAGYCSGHRRWVTRDLFSLTSFKVLLQGNEGGNSLQSRKKLSTVWSCYLI